MNSDKPLGITDVVLRDASQSLLATCIRLDNMLPIAEKLDSVGYWSVESWGGATFDACIRYLGEDAWVRIGRKSSKFSFNACNGSQCSRGNRLNGCCWDYDHPFIIIYKHSID